jgi:beta-aspartyl-peptidase (threonine type)
MKNLLLLLLVIAMQTNAQTSSTNSSPKIFGLVIHGGAGAPAKENATPESDRLYHAKLQEALDAGYAVLETNGAALDAVVATIKVMEGAGMFDAGKGSVFNTEGFCELDAAIMDGRTLAAGAVTGLQHIKHPIDLARAVMDKSPHVLLMGEGAEKFARDQGFEMVSNTYFQTEMRRKQWEKLKEKKKSSGHAAIDSSNLAEALGTVGCVALDKNGNLAAGTSTGGTADKLAGRIGDSPIIGAGTYAKNATCAVSGTGVGEYYIRTVFGHNISALMEYRGLSLEAATAETMKEMQGLGGHGGCIAIDKNGDVVMPFNTPAMYRGFKLSNGKSDVQLYGEK